ncbi:site-specific integrase [Natrarchaeobaculum sulfurireducens]|uniref:Integrase domain-containing protein n=1 Tax=Natrarchaeobaculum sulfurireducens TaxID=2044521 RepID=A0A346PQJ5_9EURY|nr:site-specific integrase [Natrarchaeobaculum sulfurireducens]AXR81790.1 Integrase domain-containing protein [Natrarchaeobaculum sulfurireducens]
MRLESTQGQNQWKVWLIPDEVDALEEVAANRSHKHKVAVQLGTRVGLRAKEYTRIRPCDVHREGDSYFLRVVGKDTTGEHGEGKTRDAYLPERVERELLELQYSEDIDDTEPYFPVTRDRIRQMIHEVAEDVADEIEDGADYPGAADDWRKVSSHDLRRYFAQTCLVRRKMNPRVVMAVGGWSDFHALKPYLNAPTAEVVANEFVEAGLD